ncbi:MAG: alanine racemase [Acidimicrobiaceae bacterium]|nr:alanine racemase [Acidimicrobiaceae bacterium]
MTVYADIDLDAIRHNVQTIRATVDTPVCAVVKANAYGHGAVEVAGAALEAGASWLAVSSLPEAIELAEVAKDVPILVLSERSADEMQRFGQHLPASTRLTVGSTGGVERVAALERSFPVHLKIDTGMHRMGVRPDKVAEAVQVIIGAGLDLEGIWTHFAISDEPRDPFTAEQLTIFDEALDLARAAGANPVCVHTANSAGALLHPSSRRDLVRIGLAMYGVHPAPETEAEVDLHPVLELRTFVNTIRTVPEGATASYGRRWVARRDTRVATIPVGYADGIRRSSGVLGVDVLVRGERCPMVGNLTMDQTMVEVGPGVAVGDEVILIGRQGNDEIGANDVAGRLGTIGYEILTRLGPRIERRHR